MQNFLTPGEEISKELSYTLNYAIKKVTSDIDNVKFNTAISTLMSTVNDIYKVGKINTAEYKVLLTLINPFAPHISEEIWTKCNFEPKIYLTKWPVHDESKLVKDEIEIVVQVNSKIADRITIGANLDEQGVKEACLQSAKLNERLNGKTIVKFIYVKGKLVNFIVK